MSLSQVRGVAARMPFNAWMGIRVVRLHRDWVTIECPLRGELLNKSGVLHGGVTATMADAAVGIALHRHFGGVQAATTVEMKVSFLRPVWEGTIIARSRLIHLGRRLSVGQVDLRDNGNRLVGAALVTYMMLNPKRRR